MRGADEQQSQIFTYLSPEARVRKDHPLRAIRAMVDEVLDQLSGAFDAMYASVGRPSIAPEKLLRAQLLQMLYSIRSEGLLMEEMDYNLPFRWFVGLNADDAVWDATVFTKNRDRLLQADVAKQFLARVVKQARARGLTSDEHFTVDGTLLEDWASVKSFQPKADKKTLPPDDPGNPTVNFHGEKRSNDTHESKTDPESLLARKGQGKEAKLSYSGHLLVENKHGLIVDAEGLQANGTAERDAALLMLEKLSGTKTVTVGGDRGFDTRGFVAECRHLRVTPHVAQNHARAGGSAIDARTTRHAGYKISQRKRKRIEECFGWLNTVAGLRKVRACGSAQGGWIANTDFGISLTTWENVRPGRITEGVPCTAWTAIQSHLETMSQVMSAERRILNKCGISAAANQRIFLGIHG